MRVFSDGKRTISWTVRERIFSEHNFFVEESLTKAEQKEVEDSFFSKENDSNRERVRLVYLELEKLGIESFLFDQTFLAAYPLHDGEFDDLGYVIAQCAVVRL